MSAAITDFEKFAARPSVPEHWFDGRTAEADQLAHKMAGESGPDYQRDLERYFWLMLESRQRQKAEDSAAALEPLRPRTDGYDTAYVHRLQRLAVGELMHDNVRSMLITMQQILDYDKKYLPATDIRIARDYNNMGLVCFMIGQSSPTQPERVDFFKQSQEWLASAEAAFPQAAKCDVLSVRENQLMLAEGMSNKALAESRQREIDRLLSEIDGPAPRVVL